MRRDKQDMLIEMDMMMRRMEMNRKEAVPLPLRSGGARYQQLSFASEPNNQDRLCFLTRLNVCCWGAGAYGLFHLLLHCVGGGNDLVQGGLADLGDVVLNG